MGEAFCVPEDINDEWNTKHCNQKNHCLEYRFSTRSKESAYDT